jgi:hypothetical protein
MMDVWGELIDRARFARVRLGGEASWWLHQTSQERLLRYESEMNRTIPAELAVLCLYDLNRFSAGVLVDVVQTHPRALINEMIIEYPSGWQPPAAAGAPGSGSGCGGPSFCLITYRARRGRRRCRRRCAR